MAVFEEEEDDDGELKAGSFKAVHLQKLDTFSQ